MHKMYGQSGDKPVPSNRLEENVHNYSDELYTHSIDTAMRLYFIIYVHVHTSTYPLINIKIHKRCIIIVYI